MNSSNPNPQPAETANVSYVTIPTEIMLSLTTGPLLLGVLATKASLEWLQAIGQASEEVFRGDRLPILDFPDSKQIAAEREGKNE